VTPVRVGCVGTGFIAGRHLEALSGMPDVEIAAVADPLADRAAETAERYGARAYDDGLALLDAEELDAVWLCVPPYAHGPLESAALDRSLPFFVEKPLALDLATAETVAARVAEANLLTAVGYHWRHLDVVRTAAGLLRDRPPHLVTGYWLDRTPPAPWWAHRDRSGGQVLEQTTHIFDLARMLVGEVVAVQAVEVAAPLDGEGDAPAAASALLTFESGAVGTISSARSLAWRHRVALHAVSDAQVVEVTERRLVDHGLVVTSPDGAQVTTSGQDPIAAEDAEFVAALRGEGAGPRVPYAEALRTHALTLAADRSAREGTRIELAGARG
jgi:myo-inositol 2-dehydrogenase/D-chiro-inositol 1-dehydrogenase